MKMNKSKFSPWIRCTALLLTAVFLPQQLCLAGIISDFKSGRLPNSSSIKSAAQHYVSRSRTALSAVNNVYGNVKSATGLSAKSFASFSNNINIQNIKSAAGITTAVLTRNPQAGIAVANTNWAKAVSNELFGIKNTLYDKAVWARDQTVFKPGFFSSEQGREHLRFVNQLFIFVTGPFGAADGLVSSAGGLLTTGVARYAPSLAGKGSSLIEWAAPKLGQGSNWVLNSRPAAAYGKYVLVPAGIEVMGNTFYGYSPFKSAAFTTYTFNQGRITDLMSDISRRQHSLKAGTFAPENYEPLISDLSTAFPDNTATPEGVKDYLQKNLDKYQKVISDDTQILSNLATISNLSNDNKHQAGKFNSFEKGFTALAEVNYAAVNALGNEINNLGIPFAGEFVKSAGSFTPFTGLSIGASVGTDPGHGFYGFANFFASPVENGIGLREGSIIERLSNREFSAFLAGEDYHSNYRNLGKAAGSAFIILGGGREVAGTAKAVKAKAGAMDAFLSAHPDINAVVTHRYFKPALLIAPLAGVALWEGYQNDGLGKPLAASAIMFGPGFIKGTTGGAPLTGTLDKNFHLRDAATGDGLSPKNIKSVPLPSSIEVNPFELSLAHGDDNLKRASNTLNNELSGIKLETLSIENLNEIGKRIAEETKNILAGKGSNDMSIDNLVAREFAGLVKNRNFNIRPDQLAFTYVTATHLAQSNLGMPTKGLAVGLKMSGGKEDGYLSGIKVALDITQRINANQESKASKIKNIYIDPDSKNLGQIKDNPTVERLAKDYNVFTIEDAHTPVLIGQFKPGKPQIYLMENYDAKSIGLDEKKADPQKNKILEGVSGVVVNEIQLVLVDADLIKGPREGIYLKLTDNNAKVLVMKEVGLLRIITEEINKEAGLHNEGIEEITKTRSLLNGKEIRSEYQLKPKSSRKILENIAGGHKDLLKDLGYDKDKGGLLNLIDLAADTLFNKEKGRHYWITEDNKTGKYVDYRIADSDGTERPNTRFGSQEVAGLIALKEGATDEQVADNLLHKETDRITTTELLKKIGIDKVVFGSGTLEGQGKTLGEMEVSTIRVTPEEKLDWNNGKNKLEVISASTAISDTAQAINKVVELIKNKTVEQVAVTDISARKLQEVRDGILKAMDEGIIPRSEIEFVTGENRQLQGRKFEEIRENNKIDPTKKPILIIQGMGAGVNTFSAPNGKYKVALIKIGVDSSDKLIQLGGRINREKRAEGTFSVIVNVKQDKSITTKEKEALRKLDSPEAKQDAVLKISEEITKEQDLQGVSRLQQEARKVVDVSRRQTEVTDKDIEYLQSEYLKKIKQRTGVIAQGDITTAAQLEKHLSQRGLSQPVEALKSLGLIFDGRVRGTQDELTLRGKRFLNFLADFEEQIMKGSANPYQFLKIARDQVRIRIDIFLSQLNNPDNSLADLKDKLGNLAMEEDFLNKILESGKDVPTPYVILNIWSLLNTPILKPQILEALEDQDIFIKSKDVENLQLTDIPQYSQLKDEEVKKIKSDLFEYLLNIESVGGIKALNNLIKDASIKEMDILVASEGQIRIWLNAENFKNGDLNRLFNSGYGKEIILKLVNETRGNPELLKAWLAQVLTDMADLKTDFTVEKAKIEFYEQAKQVGIDEKKIENAIGIIDRRLVTQPAISKFAKELNKTVPALIAELIIEDIKLGKSDNLKNKLHYCFSEEAITQLADKYGLEAIQEILTLNLIEENKSIVQEAKEFLAQPDNNGYPDSPELKVIAEAIFNTNSPERIRAISEIKATLSVLPSTASTAPAPTSSTVTDSEVVKAAAIGA